MKDLFVSWRTLQRLCPELRTGDGVVRFEIVNEECRLMLQRGDSCTQFWSGMVDDLRIIEKEREP
jgi:hypothetical protein